MIYLISKIDLWYELKVFHFKSNKKGIKQLNTLPNEIFQKWMHSFEEDEGDITVYRSEEYNFPRARGRGGIEFKPDGTFIDWEIGATDAQQPISGHWQIEGNNRVQISFNENERTPRTLEILEHDPGLFKVRQN